MAPPEAAKQARIAPQPASETMSRRDQMKFPLSDSGMPGLPPGMNLLVLEAGTYLTRRFRTVKPRGRRRAAIVRRGPQDRDDAVRFEGRLTGRAPSGSQARMGDTLS